MQRAATEFFEVWSEWAKAWASNPNGECLQWRWLKSGYCNGGECAEARQVGTVQVRDSKLGDASPVLEYPPGTWKVFLSEVRGA